MKLVLRQLLVGLALLGAVSFTMLPLAGCGEQTTTEDMGETMEDAGEDMGEAVEEGMDEAGDAIDDMAE